MGQMVWLKPGPDLRPKVQRQFHRKDRINEPDSGDQSEIDSPIGISKGLKISRTSSSVSSVARGSFFVRFVRKRVSKKHWLAFKTLRIQPVAHRWASRLAHFPNRSDPDI